MKNVRVLIRYDVENLSDATFERACNGVFAEPPVDVLYREDFPREESDHIFFCRIFFLDSLTREQILLFSAYSLSKRMSCQVSQDSDHFM